MGVVFLFLLLFLGCTARHVEKVDAPWGPLGPGPLVPGPGPGPWPLGPGPWALALTPPQRPFQHGSPVNLMPCDGAKRPRP